MVRKRKPLPDVGDFVVATVRQVFDYGAYVTLDEYNNLEAYLPWSEIASRWVRNIRDVLKEGRKIVVKVIRVNKAKRQVDVSLKRVYDNERKKKMIEWKRAQKAEKILELTAQSIGRSLDDAYDQVGWKLEDYYGEIMAGLEEAAMRGPEALREAGIPEEWTKPLMEQIRRHIEVKRVKVRGLFVLRSMDPDGIEKIRSVLSKAYEQVDGDVKVRVYTIGVPRYRVEVEATDYKTAEKALSRISEAMLKAAKKLGVEASYTRERS